MSAGHCWDCGGARMVTASGALRCNTDGCPGKVESWGVSHTIALAMVALNLDVVHRGTLRALLPKGRVTGGHGHRTRAIPTTVRRVNGLDAGSRRLIERGLTTANPYDLATRGERKNHISEKFQVALKRFEDYGWITRGERYVLVRSRRELMDWTANAQPPDDFELDFATAVEAIRTDIDDPHATAKAVEQRRQELLAIQRLMEEGFGSRNWSGRGSVRFVPRSKTI